MRLTPVVFAILIAVSTTALCQAQEQHIWIPEGLEILQRSASSKTEFTLDHSMPVFASKLEPGGDDVRRVIAGLSGISIRRYRFSQPDQYDQDIFRSMSEKYRLAGWKQVMTNHDKEPPGLRISGLDWKTTQSMSRCCWPAPTKLTL